MAKSAFSKKQWYDVVAPAVFDNKVCGSTVAADASQVDGRTVQTSLQELYPSTNKYYMTVGLQVDTIEGNQAKTSLSDVEVARDYISRIVRRGSDTLEVVADVTTKDAVSLRVKVVGITLQRKERDVLTKLRHTIHQLLHEEAQKANYQDFLKAIFDNTFQKQVLQTVKTIYPLRVFEVRKIEA